MPKQATARKSPSTMAFSDFQWLGKCFILSYTIKKYFILLFIATLMLTADNVDAMSSAEVGIASYYSYECADQPMANGRIFNPEKRTCASWFYDFGTVLVVKSLDTGLTTEVIVTDRGPNKRLLKQGRIIDLSKRAFQDICRLEKGLTKVVIHIKDRL